MKRRAFIARVGTAVLACASAVRLAPATAARDSEPCESQHDQPIELNGGDVVVTWYTGGSTNHIMRF